MNPSAPGWIKKRFPLFAQHFSIGAINKEQLYLSFREIGFVYGTSFETIFISDKQVLKWTEEEITKINLFDSLALNFIEIEKSADYTAFTEKAVKFYELLNRKNEGFLKLPRLKQGNPEYLEKILQSRIQTNEGIIKKNFSHLLTNALLFLDVLAFRQFLSGNLQAYSYASEIEATITNSIFLALQQKEKKKKYDELLLKLFQASVRYNKLLKHEAESLADLRLDAYTEILEKRYLMDLSCLAVWDDDQLDFTEYKFIDDLGEKLELENTKVVDSTRFMHQFIVAHKEQISYFQYSNPVKHFYTQTRRTVSVLILRNKKRLLQELMESKELVVLLGQSTVRDLSKTEKQKVKEQLLDICKSIPSLAIFLLPGGGIMLPLLVKLIPKLLPSAFNENMREDN